MQMSATFLKPEQSQIDLEIGLYLLLQQQQRQLHELAPSS